VIKPFKEKIRLSSPVKSVTYQEKQINSDGTGSGSSTSNASSKPSLIVELENGTQERYDYVIFACHAPEAVKVCELKFIRKNFKNLQIEKKKIEYFVLLIVIIFPFFVLKKKLNIFGYLYYLFIYLFSELLNR
jgi:hypothetical protein